MVDEPKRGEYGFRGEKLDRPRTRVKTGPNIPVGAPTAQSEGGTPVQPIVIQVPQQQSGDGSGSRQAAHKAGDWWIAIGAVLVSLAVSVGVSIYVSSKFLGEYEHKLRRINTRMEVLEQKSRSLGNDIARTQTQVETYDGSGSASLSLNRKAENLEVRISNVERTLGEIKQRVERLRNSTQ